MNKPERLVRLKLINGDYLDFFRDADNTVRICSKDTEHCVIIPNASGQLTSSLFAMVEPLGEILDEEQEDANTG